MTESDVLRSLTAGMFAMNDEEVASLLYEDEKLKDNVVDIILGKSAEKIERLQGDKKADWDKAYSKGKAETAKRFEKTFLELTGHKTEKATFEEMVEEYNSKKPKSTAEDIKTNPMYLELERSSVPKTDYEALQKQFEQFKSEQGRARVLDVVKSKAWDITAKKNPILSENPAVASTRREDFLRKFEGYDYRIDGDNILVLKEDQRVEDNQGNARTFESFVMDMAESNFDFKQQEDRGSAGNDNKGQQGGVRAPQNEGEYRALLASNELSSREKADLVAKYSGHTW